MFQLIYSVKILYAISGTVGGLRDPECFGYCTTFGLKQFLKMILMPIVVNHGTLSGNWPQQLFGLGLSGGSIEHFKKFG